VHTVQRPVVIPLALLLLGCGAGDTSNGSAAGSDAAPPADASSGPTESGGPAGDSGGGSDSGGSGDAGHGGDAGLGGDSGTSGDAGALAGLHAEGNKLVDANQTVRLIGVNISGTETYCEQGIGIFQAPTVNGNVDPAVVAAMKTWKIGTVRVPLNEDCWLGINGVKSAYGGSNYIDAIKGFVQLLRGQGMYVIVDLHWNAPGGTLATSQQPMADADHSPAFWASVAQTFQGDMGVVFDLYNEPNVDGGNVTATSWKCWRDGCSISNWSGFGGSAMSAGMQSLVNAVRGAGSKNLIMVGGLGDAEFVNSDWLTYQPSDPMNPPNIAASHHNYGFNGGCNAQSCWTTNVATVAAKVPVVTGEMGESDCAHGYIDAYMSWADSAGVSYLGWTWNNWNCGSGPALVTDFYGTPTQTYGEGFKAHITSL
jgi:hypothetical protein